MKFFYLSFFAMALLGACTQTNKVNEEKKEYSHDVGDILFDSRTDDPTFALCDSTKIITRRKALAYEGDRSKIGQAFLDKFKFRPEFEPFTGYITVRFIVNCNNESGRFRAQSLDLDFSLKEAPESLKRHLIEMVQSLSGWNHAYEKDAAFDITKFINFKITKGQIENVLQ